MYNIYIMKRGVNVLKDQIKSPRGYRVWLAVVNLDGLYCLPEEINNTGIIDNYYQRRYNTVDELVSHVWDEYEKLIKDYSVFSKEDFASLVDVSLEEWVKSPAKQQQQQFGATCQQCNSFNEYALKSNSYICTSCKSYDEMYV